MQRPVLSSPVARPVWLAPSATALWRRPAVRVLRLVVAVLLRLARQLSASATPPRAVGLASLPELEFHADAGAPEGALYVNGDYVGRLEVRRL